MMLNPKNKMIEEKLKEGFKKFCPKKEISDSAECELIEFEGKHYVIELFPKVAWAGIGRIWEVIPFVETDRKPMSVWKADLVHWKEKNYKEREYLAKFLEPTERIDGLYDAIESTKYFDHFQ